ncbi:uncharacterized protein [Ptychodera flava]|uniref:uncharacterized protein n=1 Tax=Ptychodera flava TaxID=63121 RepID=UPI00396A588F
MAAGLKYSTLCLVASAVHIFLHTTNILAQRNTILSRCENLTSSCDDLEEDTCVYTFLLPRDEQKGCIGFRRSVIILRQQDKEITALKEKAENCLATLVDHESKLADLVEFKDLTEYQDRKQFRRLQRQQERWEEDLIRQQYIIETHKRDIEHLSLEKVRQQNELDRQNKRIEALEQILSSLQGLGTGSGVLVPNVAMETQSQQTPTVSPEYVDQTDFTESVFNLTVHDPIRSIIMFEINCVSYIAYVTANGTDIMVFENYTATPYQHISAEPGDITYNGLTFFKMEDQYFLTVTNCRLGNHCIYRWENGTFEEFQVIFLSGIHSWGIHYFHTLTSQGRKHFLVLPSFSKYDTRLYSYKHDIDSVIFVWNGERFVTFQTIPTSGARSVASVAIGNYVYICFANSFSGKVWPRYKVYSEIYKIAVNGLSFARHQLLELPGASAMAVAFHFGGETYLVDVMWQGVYGGLSTDTPIYIWDEDSAQFVQHQTIQTLNARMLCPFIVKNQLYFVVTNSGDSENGPFAVIYTRSKSGANFIEHQRFQATRGHHCAVYQRADENYLIIDDSVLEL